MPCMPSFALSIEQHKHRLCVHGSGHPGMKIAHSYGLLSASGTHPFHKTVVFSPLKTILRESLRRSTQASAVQISGDYLYVPLGFHVIIP
jgi:hypothetical protein